MYGTYTCTLYGGNIKIHSNEVKSIKLPQLLASSTCDTQRTYPGLVQHCVGYCLLEVHMINHCSNQVVGVAFARRAWDQLVTTIPPIFSSNFRLKNIVIVFPASLHLGHTNSNTAIASPPFQ